MKCKRCGAELPDWYGMYIMLCTPCLRDLNKVSTAWTIVEHGDKYAEWLDELNPEHNE